MIHRPRDYIWCLLHLRFATVNDWNSRDRRVALVTERCASQIQSASFERLQPEKTAVNGAVYYQRAPVAEINALNRHTQTARDEKSRKKNSYRERGAPSTSRMISIVHTVTKGRKKKRKRKKAAH